MRASTWIEPETGRGHGDYVPVPTEFIALWVTGWASHCMNLWRGPSSSLTRSLPQKWAELSALPSRITARVGARVALQPLPYPPRGQQPLYHEHTKGTTMLSSTSTPHKRHSTASHTHPLLFTLLRQKCIPCAWIKVLPMYPVRHNHGGLPLRPASLRQPLTESQQTISKPPLFPAIRPN